MRNLSDDFKDHLSGAATTLCWLWKLTRVDGTVLGFTDHDRALVIDGVSYESASGLIPSETESRLGLQLIIAPFKACWRVSVLRRATLLRGDMKTPLSRLIAPIGKILSSVST